MNIFTAPYLRVKSTMHPLTRAGREPHTFGVGLDTSRPTILVIKGLRYEATVIEGDDSTAVVRLVKLAGKGEIWDVSRGPDGLVACDCPSYVTTYEGTSATCKHGTACVENGLIAAPAPVANHVNRIARHLAPPVVAKVETVAEVAPVKTERRSDSAPTWSEADWRRAESFHLQPPAGMKRPVVVEPVVVDVIPTKPAPLVPSLDEVWHSAFQLGRAGVDALPCKTWTDAAKLAFLDGFYWGAE